MILENYGDLARQKLGVFKNNIARQHWRNKCEFWKTKTAHGEKVKYWKTIILAADTAENARFGKRQERG